MADAYTNVGAISSDQVMWDLASRYALRPQLYFDRFATVGSTDRAPDQGASVTFTTYADLAAQTAVLDEVNDPDAVAISDSQITLTLAEQGATVISTYRARATSFLPLDRNIANIVGHNAGISMDELARDVYVGGTNVRYGGAATSRVTVASGHTIVSNNIRRAFTDLSSANVRPFGQYYVAVIHPDVAYDLRIETGEIGWRQPHNYSQPDEIWNGEIGAYEGFRFIVSPRAKNFADAGVGGTVDVYASLFFGQEAFAKAFSTYEGRGALPIVIIGPVTDRMRRRQTISWHWFGKHGVFRQAALRRLETASSIGANS